jgi:predicted nucleic acid-binding protein
VGVGTEEEETLRRVVSNAGPLIHLSEADALRLLRLTGEISIPPQVASETAYYFPRGRAPEWISVASLDEFHAAESSAWQQANLLDAGEADALALARQLNADWFLTDDERARLLGKQIGLQVHGSLGVVLWAAAVRLIERKEAEEAIARLANSSLWVSAAVLKEARSALGQLYKD